MKLISSICFIAMISLSLADYELNFIVQSFNDTLNSLTRGDTVQRDAIMAKMNAESYFGKIQATANDSTNLKSEIYYYIIKLKKELFPPQVQTDYNETQAGISGERAKKKSTYNVDAYEVFLDKLMLWYPTQRNFNEKFIKFLVNKNISDEFFFQKINNMNKGDLQEMEELKEFARTSPEEINEAVYTKLQANVVHLLKPLNIVFTLEDVFNARSLKFHVEKVIKQMQLDQAYKDLEKSLTQWYLEQSSLNKKLINFLKTKNLESKVINEVSQNQSDFERFLEDYDKEFSDANKKAVEEEISVQIIERVSEDERVNTLRRNHVCEQLKKEAIKGEYMKLIYVYNPNKLSQVIRPLIGKIVSDMDYADALKTLKAQLIVWLPHGKEFIDGFQKFLEFNGVSQDSLLGLSKSRKSMFSASNIYLSDFILHNRVAFNDLMYEEVRTFLQENNAEANIKKLKAHRFETKFSAELLVDPLALKNLTLTNLLSIWTNDAYQSIEYYLELWYSNTSSAFTSAFIDHLKSKNIKLETLQSLPTNKKEMFSEKKVYFKDFILHNKEVFSSFMYREVKKILLRHDGQRAEENLEKLKRNKFEEKFSSKSLTNIAYFQDQIDFEVKTIISKECKEGLKARIGKLLITEADEVQKHFQDNKCIVEEICNRKPEFDEKYLQGELKIYVNALKRKNRSENMNIKDEIDDSIYETIQNVLKQKTTLSDDIIECIIAYTRRNNSVDRIYNTELLFDADKLLKAINPIVKEYERVHENVSARYSTHALFDEDDYDT